LLPVTVTAYNSKQKNGFVFFYFIFMGVKPFDSAALGRLIERVVDSGFMIEKRKLKHHSYITSIKSGVPFSPNHQTFKGNTYPQPLIASRERMFPIIKQNYNLFQKTSFQKTSFQKTSFQKTYFQNPCSKKI